MAGILPPPLPQQLSFEDWEPIAPVAPTPAPAPATTDPRLGSSWEPATVAPPDEFGRNIANPFQQGLLGLSDAVAAVHLMTGMAEPESFARAIVENDTRRSLIPQHAEDVQFNEELSKLEGWDQVGKIITNPRLWLQTAVQSLPASVPSLAAGAVGGIAAGPAGAVVGAGAGSFLTEFNASLVDALREASPNGGVNAADLANAIKDDAIMGRAKEFAVKRGIPVAIFDGLSMGIAGKVFAPVKAAFGGKVAGSLAGGTAEVALQGASGAAGEVGAQLASTGEVKNYGDAALEFFGEIPGALTEPLAKAPGAALDVATGRTRAPMLPEVPPGAPTEATVNPNVQPNVDPADWVPIQPEAPASGAFTGEGMVTPNAPVAVQPPVDPVSVTPVLPGQEAPAVQPVQPAPTPAVQPTSVLPTEQVPPPAPVPTEQVPPPAPAAPIPAAPIPAAPAPTPVVAPTTVPETPPAAPAPAPAPAPTPTPSEPTPAPQADGARPAPDQNSTFLRYGRALAVIEGAPTAGMTKKEKDARTRYVQNLRSGAKPGSVREDETPQQFRIGDEVSIPRQYLPPQPLTVLAVKNEGGNVKLDLIDERGNVRTNVPASGIAGHNKLAQDAPTPAKRPDWYGKSEKNDKGVKSGDTVTLKDGTRGKVVGVWKSTELSQSQGFTRKPINVAIQPEGAPDGKYRMTGLDGIASTSPGAPETPPAPTTPPEPTPAPAPAPTAVQPPEAPAPTPAPEPPPAPKRQPKTRPKSYTDPGKDYRPLPIPDVSGGNPGKIARETVVREGLATGWEHSLTIDADGDVLSHGTSRKEGQVGFSGQAYDAFGSPREKIIVHHNHPGPDEANGGDLLPLAPSPADISLLTAPGVEAVWAHTHGGPSFRIALTEAGRKLFKASNRGLVPEKRVELKRALDRAAKVANIFLQRVAGELSMKRGGMSGRDIAAQANTAYAHIITEIMARSGLVDYRGDLDLSDNAFINEATYGAMIESIVRMQGKFYGTHPDAYFVTPDGTHRGAPVLREPGDVGTVSWASGSLADAGGREGADAGGVPSRESPDGEVSGLDDLADTDAEPAAVNPEDYQLDDRGALPDLDLDEDMADADTEPDTPLRDDRRARGTLAPQTQDVSYSSGPSKYRNVWRVAGMTPEEGNLLTPREKIATLRRVLVDTFGFLAVRWEKGADVQDATAAMQNAFRNVQFMMHALGLPVKGVSLDGTLTVDLERKGRGYFGVYSPNSKTIGMPGQSNSFAHEWAHALDHFLADKLKGRGETLLSKLTRAEGLDPTVSIENAYINLIHTMFFDKSALALRALDLERQAAAVHATGPKQGQPTQAALDARRKLDDLKKGATQLRIAPSDYSMKSRNFDPGNDYWASVHEMLARAFEAYVANKVAALGGTNEFITKGEEAYLSDADRRLAMTFPKGDDRVAIFAAFDDVLDHLRRDAVLGNEPAAPRPDDTDIYDPQHWNKVVSGQPNPGLFDGLREEARKIANIGKDMVRNPTGALSRGVSRWALNAGMNPMARPLPVLSRLVDYARLGFFSTRGYILPRINRNKARFNKKSGKTERGGGDLLEDAIMDFMTKPGAGTEQARTFENEQHQQTSKDMTRIENALRGNGFADLKLSAADNKTVRELLLGRKVPGAAPELTKVASALRDMFDQAHARAKKVGIKIGYLLDQGYVPRILDKAKVANDVPKFLKKARELYGIVFDDLTQDPDFQPGDLIQLANETDRRAGNTGKVSRFEAEIKALRTAVRAAKKAAAEVENLKQAKASGKQIQQAEDRKADRDADVDAAFDALAEAVRPEFADVSAKDWYARIELGNSFTYEGHGPAEKYTESRKLPPAAEDVLADFYNDDVVNLTANYVASMNSRVAYIRRAGNPSGNDRIENVVAREDVKNRIAMNPGKYRLDSEAGRRAIITDLANPEADNLLEMRLRSAHDLGANSDDVIAVRGAIQSISGRATGGTGIATMMLNRLSGALYAYGYLRLLPRMVVTAINEPATVLLRTGSAKATFKTFAAYLAELNQKNLDVRQRRELARAMGLISSPLYDQMLMAQMGMDQGHIGSTNVLMSRFFTANFAAAVTNAQRRSTMYGGFIWMRDMAQKFETAKNAGDKAVIEAEFKELGVREEDIPAFMDWLRQVDTLPDTDALNTKAGRVFEQAVFRFVGQVIQDPSRADKPMAASTPLGRLAFALTSYLYAFFSNVHAATLTRTMRDYQLYRDTGSTKFEAGANAIGRASASFVGGFSLIFASQLITTAIRETMFNGEQWEKHRADGDLFPWLLGLAGSRTGILGPFDVINNAFTGIKYERDLSNMIIGPSLQSITADVMAVSRVFSDENSPNTNNTEREAVKAIYRGVVAPALSAALSAADSLGPVTAGLRWGAMAWGTSNSAASFAADVIAGPKTSN